MKKQRLLWAHQPWHARRATFGETIVVSAKKAAAARSATGQGTGGPSSLSKAFAHRLILLVNLLSRPFYARYGQQFDIGINEWRIIRTLASCPGISASEICYLSGLHKMNVSRGVRRLAKQDRVSSGEDPDDRRRKILNLTPKGHAVFASVSPPARAKEKAMMAALTAAEQKAFSEMLDKLVDQIRQSGSE